MEEEYPPGKRRLEIQPNLLKLLVLNSIHLTKGIREDYITFTQEIGHELRATLEKMKGPGHPVIRLTDQYCPESYLDISKRHETVCHIDGGIKSVEIFSRSPIVARAGIYIVRTGDKDLKNRELFLSNPVYVGDLESGLRDRGDYLSVVRIILELQSAIDVISDLDKFPELDVCCLHGPITYRLSAYSAHWFSESDLLKITNMQDNDELERFRTECESCPLHDVAEKADYLCSEFEDKNQVRAVCWIFNQTRQLLKNVTKRGSNFVFLGAVERARSKEFLRQVLPAVLQNNPSFVNRILARDLEDPYRDTDLILESARYTDSLLLGLILKEGEFTSPQTAKERYSGFRRGFGFASEDGTTLGDLFPKVKYSFIKVTENNLPFRIEFFEQTLDDTIYSGLRRAQFYSLLLPQYVFPVGLDIADKYARIPNWMTEAYKASVLFLLGEELVSGHLTPEDYDQLIRLIVNERGFYQRPKGG